MVANIVAPVLKELIPAARASIVPNGLLILSGILDTQQEEMTVALIENGYEVVESLAAGEWVAILARNSVEEIKKENLHRVFVDKEAIDVKKKH
jgi:ribosomal protein L11 methyltransferase